MAETRAREPRNLNMQPVIKGLSLTRPWPKAFELGKRVENRHWRPPDTMIGHYLALHAAKSWSDEDAYWIARITGEFIGSDNLHPSGMIFAVCRLAGFVKSEFDGTIPDEQKKWFAGPQCWLLDEYVRLDDPVPCLGTFGLWDLDAQREGLDFEVREEYKTTTGHYPE